ncbi:hypothetical protein O3Q52_14370 [Streptomyces sp. ActVer]|uniref:hypothetical protein n=1 Tax=Streptomyces sp. ActVer TaxID=3014558 RepID=UPI0022B5341E|nr:hypothetical protein [Streptomyces sp. ActVer]MCZ4509361.1 hypothetical protein [Streptomyces sp. ActVer]
MPTPPRSPQKPYISPHTWAQFIETVEPLELTGPRALELALDSYARGLIPLAVIDDIDPRTDRKQVNMRISGAVWQRAESKRQDDGRYANMATLVSKIIGAVVEGRLSITMSVIPNPADPRTAAPQTEAESGIRSAA